MNIADMKNEGHVKDAIKSLLDELGAWHYMHVPVGYGRAGIPDHTVCLHGVFIAIEAKFSMRDTSANQLRELKHITEAGGLAFRVNQWGLPELEILLRKFASGEVTRDMLLEVLGERPFFDLQYKKPKVSRKK